MSIELIESLTHYLRVLSVRQIVSVFCNGACEEAEELIAERESEGLVERQSVLARPILCFAEPIASWRPGEKVPDFGKVAYRLKTRWNEPVQPTEIVMASKAAAKHFGGYLGGRWPRTSEVTHDINLAEVFLRYHTHSTDDVDVWIPEAQLYAEGRGHRERLPDAVIRRRGVDLLVVEFGGSYGKQKLESFHREMNELPYEIW